MDIMKKLKKLVHREPRKKNRMIVLKKKQLVALSLIILVGIAGYLNWSFKYDMVDPDVTAVYNEASKKLGEAQMVNSPEEEADPSGAMTNGYFSQARLERETKRDESIETLLELVNSDSADKTAKQVAQEQIQELADYTQKEVTMENMIKAKGFSDTVVFMGENLISVAVFSSGLNEVDAAVISDIAVSVTGYTADKVNIVEVGE